MRLHFPNLDRPKKAAKFIARRLSVPLSSAQRSIARACGYADWNELERLGRAAPACLLDQELSTESFIQRRSQQVLSISRELQFPSGDVQHVLSDARLSGDRRAELRDEISIRLFCWRMTDLPIVGRRRQGAIGTIKSPGRYGEIVILVRYDRPTFVVTHDSVAILADFEYVTPKLPCDLFLPMRLYLPYGYWTEKDGARVVFSRDYKPMWRLRDGRKPERLDPWLWIEFEKQTHIWPARRHLAADAREVAERYLRDHGIHSLPVLADGLPLLVRGEAQSMESVADLLEAQRQPSAPAAEWHSTLRVVRRRRSSTLRSRLSSSPEI